MAPNRAQLLEQLGQLLAASAFPLVAQPLSTETPSQDAVASSDDARPPGQQSPTEAGVTNHAGGMARHAALTELE